MASMHWTGDFSDDGREWDGLRRRVLAVITALGALEPSGTWSPSGAGERTG
jgi:hypothetical protein